jgi:hypothetical protein
MQLVSLEDVDLTTADIDRARDLDERQGMERLRMSRSEPVLTKSRWRSSTKRPPAAARERQEDLQNDVDLRQAPSSSL